MTAIVYGVWAFGPYIHSVLMNLVVFHPFNCQVNYFRFHASVNIFLIKNISFWQKMRLSGEICRIHMVQYLVNINQVSLSVESIFTIKLHFLPNCDVVSTKYWWKHEVWVDLHYNGLLNGWKTNKIFPKKSKFAKFRDVHMDQFGPYCQSSHSNGAYHYFHIKDISF